MKNKTSKLTEFIIFMVEDMDRTDFWGICAQMSFYIIMAFFPLIIFLINFVGRFIVQFKDYLFDILKEYLPQLSYDYVRTLIDTLTRNLADNNYILVLFTFFFATLAARAIMTGMNQNYGNRESRSHLKIWLLSFLFTVLFAISIILIISAYVFSEAISEYILVRLGIDQFNIILMNIFTLVFSLVTSIFLFTCVYVLAPDRHLRFVQGLPGAVFSTLGINIAFRIFLKFMNHSTKYTLLYGNFGGLFALLVGIYFVCVILNLGGKINVFFSR